MLTILTYLTFDKDANNCEKLSVSRIHCAADCALRDLLCFFMSTLRNHDLRTSFLCMYLSNIFSGKIDSSYLLGCFSLHVPRRPTRNVSLFNVPFARVSSVKTGTFMRLATQANHLIHTWTPRRISFRIALACLTRAPLGYFYNAPHCGGSYFEPPPPSDLRNYWTDSKNSSRIWKPRKNCGEKTNLNDLGVTSDVTGQVKVKMFDFSGLVTSASKISRLS